MSTATSYAAAAAAGSRHFPPLKSPPATITTTAVSESDDSSTSGGDSESESQSQPSSALEISIFSTYLHVSGGGSLDADLTKIRSFLAGCSSRGQFSACLICLERIRLSDPVWSCSSGCYVLFHLVCIQSWGQQCSSVLPSSSFSSSSLSSSNNWHCPKCRLTYAKELIPREYLCYCGKVESPPLDPWILPHSCGDVCGRSLRGSCGHECLLLCHPGPCPPCPKLVSSQCFCGSTKDVRRCALKAFSCNKRCCRLSACRVHQCPEKCHEGMCPPCRVKSVYKCLCGRLEEDRECSEHEFQCERSCDGMLKCGKHPCERGCHSGGCGDCPLQGKRTCPCGKKFYHGVTCDAIVPTCGSTCEKKMSCNLHRCPERCHRGKCAETCRIITLKSCRCGSLKKEIPCHQDLSCERKCQRLRDCGRHACKRRCCEGNCPPCPEICGKKLRCNNHKCPSPCHRGVCSPCPLMVTISCFCGETHFEVPCGVEKDQKPPKCPRPCQVSRLCRHSSVSRKHKCHYGACPPCRMTCKEQLSCDHICKQRCHGPVPPANPEFTLKPKKKKTQRQNENKPGTPCLPCQEIVMKSCLGNHLGGELSMLCSDKRRFSCPNSCGNLLQCGNHYCTKHCHVLKQQNADDLLAQSCEECLLPCQKEREPTCQHPCSLPCHTDDCPPCKILIKRSCHCGAMVHVFECVYFNSLSHDEQQNVRTCRGPCHRKLLNCPHLCPDICHPGRCPSIDTCNKKATVRCACQNLRKEWRCQDVQNVYHTDGHDPRDVFKNRFGLGILPCNSECTAKLKARDSELLLRKTNVVENKVPADAERFPKRRKKRERVKEVQPISRFQGIKAFFRRFLMFLMILLILVASMYYGYKGIFWLSDWMNEIENRRPKKSYPRF